MSLMFLALYSVGCWIVAAMLQSGTISIRRLGPTLVRNGCVYLLLGGVLAFCSVTAIYCLDRLSGESFHFQEPSSIPMIGFVLGQVAAVSGLGMWLVGALIQTLNRSEKAS